MIRILSKNEQRNGSKVTLFAAGTVEISKEGTFEVENLEVAQEVVNTYPDDFEIYDSEKTTETTTEAPVVTETTTLPVEETLKQKSETDELNPSKEENTIGGDSAEKDELIKALLTKSMPELKEMASAFPASEWSQLSKKQLIEFLKGKL